MLGEGVFQLLFSVVGAFATICVFTRLFFEELIKLLETFGNFLRWFRRWRRSLWPA